MNVNAIWQTEVVYGVPDLSRPLKRLLWRGWSEIIGYVTRSPFAGVGRCSFKVELTAISLPLFNGSQQLPVACMNPLMDSKVQLGVISTNRWLMFLTPDCRNIISVRARTRSSS